MQKKFFLQFLFCFLLFSMFPATGLASEKKPIYDPDVSPFLNQLFDGRTKLLITDKPEKIKDYYLMNEKASVFAFQHEMIRSKYLNSWASKRGVKIINALGTLRVMRITKNGDLAKVFLYDTLKITYTYPDTPDQPQSFGIGTRHSIKLKKIKDQWFVLREWYLDPIEEDFNFIPSELGEGMLEQPLYYPRDESFKVYSNKRRYNREKAVIYAIKYAGACWGAGNNHRYNPKYVDFTYLGGDCTNFASQVIGDPKEGGGLSMRRAWYYNGGGSESWTHTDSFKNFLLNSGYGKVIARGSFSEVQKPTPRYPKGALAKLQPGDLIGYDLNGDIDHFSIVVGRDNHGYVLVNSHTGDRNQVPWDLGWDKSTRFVLIHINDY